MPCHARRSCASRVPCVPSKGLKDLGECSQSPVVRRDDRAPRVPCHACRVGATVKSVFFENFLSPKISKKGPDIVHRGPFRRTHSDPPKKSSREVFFP